MCVVNRASDLEKAHIQWPQKILIWRNIIETGKCYHVCLIFRYKHIMLISVDASWREKHIGTIPSALSLFYQKLEAKNECDLI